MRNFTICMLYLMLVWINWGQCYLPELVARIVEMRTEDIVLVRNPKGKRPLRKPRHRWEDNIKLDLRETWCAQSYVLLKCTLYWWTFQVKIQYSRENILAGLLSFWRDLLPPSSGYKSTEWMYISTGYTSHPRRQ
jgi:hypothetical protein